MALDRTWYNSLIDDDGSGLTGSVWDKADVDSLMDAVDAEIARIDANAANGGYPQPWCSVYLASIGQTVPSGVHTIITFDTEEFDGFGMFNPATPDRILIQKTGIYLLQYGIFWENAPQNGARSMTLLWNGNDIGNDVLNDINASTYTPQHASQIFVLQAGSYVQLRAFQTSTGNTRTGAYGRGSTNYFKAYMMGV